MVRGRAGIGRWHIPALMALHVAGLVLSLYLTWVYDMAYYLVGDEAMLCTWGRWFNCYAVVQSRWADIVPGWPVSSVAVAYFALQLIWTGTEGPTVARMRPDPPLLLNVAACLIGVIWLGAMVFSVQALCPFCLGIDLVLWTSLLIRWLGGRPAGESPAALSAGRATVLIAVVVLAIAAPKLAGAAFARALMRKDAASILATPKTPELVGNAGAPRALVAFIDFGCPICRRGSFTLRELQRRHPGAFRLEVRHYPINPACNPTVPKSSRSEEHRWSCEAAQIAAAADQEGRLEDVYRLFYDHQEALGSEVARLGKDPALSARLASGEPEKRVAGDVALGIKLKLDGVPTYFLDGHPVEGPRDLEEWEMLLEGLEGRSSR